MRIWSVAPVAAAAFAAIGASSGPLLAEQGHRLSGPHTYENLAVYFVHGVSASGAVPLTLQEAVTKGRVQVIETGRVNELQIENTGTEPVFVQAGDIVKGGKQDRVLTVSFLLPAKSGRLPIASFCVEQGRWTARGKEDVNKFSSASEAMPSRAALLAMATPAPAKDGGFRPAGDVPASGEVSSQATSRSGTRWQRRRASWRAASTPASPRQLRRRACSSVLKTRGCKAPAPAIWRR